MSLKQIHVLEKVVRKEHRNLKRELKLLEMKKVVLNKLQTFMDDVTSTITEIVNRFLYEEATVNTKRR